MATLLLIAAVILLIIVLILYLYKPAEGFRKNIWSVSGGYYEIPDMCGCKVFQKGVLQDLFTYAAPCDLPEDKNRYLRFADFRCKKATDDPLADEVCPARDPRVKMLNNGVIMKSVKNYSGLPFNAYDLNPWNPN